ncbi:Predicted membrane protein [uncultured Flavonifractor sp.]|nr:Predicted membrane protein [uncultured Flavonifractor sp.]
MSEPVVFGFPISLLFLYFVIYAFLGWILETVYCSVRERRFVARGFLYGPVCPIYGVGVLMMLCWFAPFTGQPLLFYVIATVCMSAWEYLVAWILETTTHIKYWDYSDRKFNLHGRICLSISLTWGVLAYLVIFWIHPVVAGLVERLSTFTIYMADVVLLVLLVADAAATIRELALLTAMLRKLTQMGEELQVQLALSRAELSDRLDEAREVLSDRLDDAKESISDRLDDARESISDKLDDAKESISDRLDVAKESISGRLDGARESLSDRIDSALDGTETNLAELGKRYAELLRKAERQTRHLRYVYRGMSSSTLSTALSQLSEASRKVMAERVQRRNERRTQRQDRKHREKV